MKVATASLEKSTEMTMEDLEIGTSLIPMSAFKQVDKTSVFAIPDDYIPNIKNFLWVGKRKDVNDKEFEVFYCKESFAKEFVSKIKDGDPKETAKFLEESMVSLEDYNFSDKPTEGNKGEIK